MCWTTSLTRSRNVVTSVKQIRAHRVYNSGAHRSRFHASHYASQLLFLSCLLTAGNQNIRSHSHWSSASQGHSLFLKWVIALIPIAGMRLRQCIHFTVASTTVPLPLKMQNSSRTIHNTWFSFACPSTACVRYTNGSTAWCRAGKL